MSAPKSADELMELVSNGESSIAIDLCARELVAEKDARIAKTAALLEKTETYVGKLEARIAELEKDLAHSFNAADASARSAMGEIHGLNKHIAELEAALAAQGAGELAGYVRRHPSGELSAEYLHANCIEEVRKRSGAWVPVFAGRPPAPEQAEALKDLARIKSNLEHQRRFGQDTFVAWKNAAVYAEGDIEDAIAKGRQS